MRPWATPHRESTPTGAKSPGRDSSSTLPKCENGSEARRAWVEPLAASGTQDLGIPVITLTLPAEPRMEVKRIENSEGLLGVRPPNKYRRALHIVKEHPLPFDGPFLLAHIPEDRLVPPDREVFFFKTRIKDQWAHALADTGASENFMSARLANHLTLEQHPRKRALYVRLANVELAQTVNFVRATVHIGTLSAHMAFAIFPT